MAKEFRYLRILIVKTAIHQRFMTIRLQICIKFPLILMALGKIQHLYNILYIADACVLGKQLWFPILCHLQIMLFEDRPYYRMYGRNLPSSLYSIISAP